MKFWKNKSGVALLLALVMTLPLFTAARAILAEEDNGLNEPGALPLVDEQQKITIGVPKPPSVEDLNTNWFTGWLEEKCNVDLEFIEYPAKEAATKLEVEITSDQELPDMIWGFWLTDAAEYRYGKNGSIVDLYPYYESGSVWIKEILESPDNTYDMLDYLLAPDGKMYSVGRLQEETHTEYFQKSFINKSWLDELGLEVPKTTDELYEVLCAFRDDDPNGNGEADEVPLVSSVTCPPDRVLMNSFIYNNGSNRLNIDDDGKLYPAYTQDEWREGLRFMHKLVEEDLLSPLSFTQDHQQAIQMMQNPDTEIVGMLIEGPIGGMFNGRVPDYETLAPLEGPEGIAYAQFAASFPAKTGQVTKYAANPELCFRLMDFMWNKEASELQRYGELGVDWVRAEEGDVGLCENIGFPAARKFTPDGVNSGDFPVQNKWYNFAAPMALRYDIVNGLVDNGPDDYNRLTHGSLDRLVNKRPDKVITKIFYTPEQLEDIAEISAAIDTYVQESIASFAVGDMSIEDDWDAYLEELNNMGLEHYLEVTQAAYDAKPIDVAKYDYKVAE